MTDFFTQFATRLQKGANLTPIILVIGTMIGLLVVRNNHLSDKPRQNLDELLYKMHQLSSDSELFTQRANSLFGQNKIFLKRYASTCNALLCLVFSLILFGIVDLIPGDGVLKYLVCGLSLLAAALLLSGLIITAKEFLAGRETLEMNNQTVNCWKNAFFKDRK